MSNFSINKVTLAGNVGAEPITRRTPEDKAVVSLRLATSKKYKDGKEWKEITEWHNLKFFDKIAEQAENRLQKGTSIYVEGELHTRKYMDKDTKLDRYITEVVVHELKVIDRAKKGIVDGTGNRANASSHAGDPNLDDDAGAWSNFGSQGSEALECPV